MDHTFGKTLLHFSYSCELIDDATLTRFRDLILDYTGKVLEIDADRLFLLGAKNNEKVLLPFGPARCSNYQIIDVTDSNGHYVSLAGLVYGERKPVWVVSIDPENPDIRSNNQKQDLWSGIQPLPPYWNSFDHSHNGGSLGTAIIIPLLRDGKIYGVHSFETSERLEATAGAKDELQLIADAMCNVYIANLHFQTRMKHTREACNQLNNFLQKPLPVLTKPNIFLASANNADPTVITTIKSVIANDYKDKFNLVFWQDLHQSGNINTHLLHLLSKCRFGICYFSEQVQLKHESGCQAFQDNPNVIFEAGMLHSRSVNNIDFPADWIPIREKQTTQAPFDFQAERTITVPRQSDGTLDELEFINILKKHLNELIMPTSGVQPQRTRVA